ncbi:MAG: hypothetical protein ABIH76_06065 [Candidatus Bathyarchaeota archaeon]
MDPTLLLAVISPMAALTTVSVVAFYYLSGMKQVNEYERELKELRHQVIKGNLGHKTFRYMKDNLRVEDLYNTELKRLDDMFQQNSIDAVTYDRMKKVLQLTFNEKLVKIHTKHSSLNMA